MHEMEIEEPKIGQIRTRGVAKSAVICNKNPSVWFLHAKDIETGHRAGFFVPEIPIRAAFAAFADHQHALRPLIFVITHLEARARLLIHKARYLT